MKKIKFYVLKNEVLGLKTKAKKYSIEIEEARGGYMLISYPNVLAKFLNEETKFSKLNMSNSSLELELLALCDKAFSRVRSYEEA